MFVNNKAKLDENNNNNQTEFLGWSSWIDATLVQNMAAVESHYCS